jgi:hypothetical protein
MHSGRKHAANKTKKLGAQTHEVEFRRRWAGDCADTVVSCQYVHVEDQYMDAYVGGLLCDGGPVMYKAKEGLIITDEFLFTHVIPNIWWSCFQHNNRILSLHGPSKTWGVFNAETADLLPLAMMLTRIKTDFVSYFGNHDQLVVKVTLEIVKVGTRLGHHPLPRPSRGRLGTRGVGPRRWCYIWKSAWFNMV